MITYNGKEFRNLVEQVQKNKEDIARHYEESRVLADYGITIVANVSSVDDLPDPLTYTGVFGDAYAVGPDGGPYDFYIYTRPNDAVGGTENRWLNIGQLAIAGPKGPQGNVGPQGPAGTNAKWYSGNTVPAGSGFSEGDMFLSTNTNTNGYVYRYANNTWGLLGNIRGPQGIQGPEGKQGLRGPEGPQGPQGPRGAPAPIVEILGILDSESQLPDPTEVDLNAGFLITEEGVNYLYIIMNGIWVKSGRWGGGSAVYVNDAFVETFDADTKLDRKNISNLPVASRGAIYGMDINGRQKLFKAGSSGSFNANIDKEGIPMYDASGWLYAKPPNSNDSSVSKVATVGWVKTQIQNAHNNTEIFHLGVFGVKTADISSLPQYNIPIAPFGYSSNIQLKCDAMFHTGSDYLNVPVPCYIQFTMTSPPDPDGNTEYYWTIYETLGNSTMCSGYCRAITTDQALENAYFQIGDDQYYNEAYITIHCPHDSTWYFPQS